MAASLSASGRAHDGGRTIDSTVPVPGRAHDGGRTIASTVPVPGRAHDGGRTIAPAVPVPVVAGRPVTVVTVASVAGGPPVVIASPSPPIVSSLVVPRPLRRLRVVRVPSAVPSKPTVRPGIARPAVVVRRTFVTALVGVGVATALHRVRTERLGWIPCIGKDGFVSSSCKKVRHQTHHWNVSVCLEPFH